MMKSNFILKVGLVYEDTVRSKQTKPTRKPLAEYT